MTAKRTFPQIYGEYWHWAGSPLTTTIGFVSLLATDPDLPVSGELRELLSQIEASCLALTSCWGEVASQPGFAELTPEFTAYFPKKWANGITIANQIAAKSRYSAMDNLAGLQDGYSEALPIIRNCSVRIASDFHHVWQIFYHIVQNQPVEKKRGIDLKTAVDTALQFLPAIKKISVDLPSDSIQIQAGAQFSDILFAFIGSHYFERNYAYRLPSVSLPPGAFQIDRDALPTIRAVQKGGGETSIDIHTDLRLKIAPQTIPLRPERFTYGNRLWLAAWLLGEYGGKGALHLSSDGCWFQLTMPAFAITN